MKYLNNCFLVIVLIQTSSYAVFIEEAKTLSEGATQSAEKLANAGQKMAESAVEASASLGADAAGKIAAVGDKFAIISGAVVCIVAANQVITLAKDIKSAVLPSDEQKAREVKYKKKYERLMKEKELKACLINNASSTKAASGIPLVCEKAVQLFAMAAGNDEELNKLIEVFKKYFK